MSRMPKSKRECKCGRLVKASSFARMAGGYQAWGWCVCGTAHSFNEWMEEMK